MKSQITGIRLLPVVSILISVGVSALLPYAYYLLFNVKLDATMTIASVFILSSVLGFGLTKLVTRRPSLERISTLYTCTQCGATVGAGKRFCTKCGTPQPATTLESRTGQRIETVEPRAVGKERAPVEETKTRLVPEAASTSRAQVAAGVAAADSRFCAECGPPIAPDDSFCHECGSSKK